MLTDTAVVHARLDHWHACIENHPDLLDAEFDQDWHDLERAFEDLRQRLNS